MKYVVHTQYHAVHYNVFHRLIDFCVTFAPNIHNRAITSAFASDTKRTLKAKISLKWKSLGDKHISLAGRKNTISLLETWIILLNYFLGKSCLMLVRGQRHVIIFLFDSFSEIANINVSKMYENLNLTNTENIFPRCNFI